MFSDGRPYSAKNKGATNNLQWVEGLNKGEGKQLTVYKFYFSKKDTKKALHGDYN